MIPRERTWVIIIIVATVIVAIALYAWLGNSASAPSTTVSNTSAGSPGSVAFAPTGRLVSGFPKNLILDSSAAINGSYSINYSPGTNQYTAEWNASSSMKSLYEAYKTYLPAHGWAILNDFTKYPTSRGLYVRNASSDVSVAIVAHGNGSQVILTYLAK